MVKRKCLLNVLQSVQAKFINQSLHFRLSVLYSHCKSHTRTVFLLYRQLSEKYLRRKFSTIYRWFSTAPLPLKAIRDKVTSLSRESQVNLKLFMATGAWRTEAFIIAHTYSVCLHQLHRTPRGQMLNVFNFLRRQAAEARVAMHEDALIVSTLAGAFAH